MIILTAYNEEQAPLGALTVPLMREYAERWGLKFRCRELDCPKQDAYWAKITETLDALQGNDAVFWLDADQMITNPEVPPLDVGSMFIASRDWGHDATGEFDFSMCGYIASRACRNAFGWVDSRREQFRNGSFPEQTPMRQYFSQNPDDLWLWPRRRFNAVPDEVCPGKVPEPWQPGDFAAHLTMLPVEDRVKLFHEIQRLVTA